MTPSGVATRSNFSPFGRSHDASTRPIGSGKSAISSTAAAIASRRAGVSVKRSRKLPVRPCRLPSATSSALAARISEPAARTWAAMACSAAVLIGAGASAIPRAAAFARAPNSRITSPTPSAPKTRASRNIIRLAKPDRRDGSSRLARYSPEPIRFHATFARGSPRPRRGRRPPARAPTRGPPARG